MNELQNVIKIGHSHRHELAAELWLAVGGHLVEGAKWNFLENVSIVAPPMDAILNFVVHLKNVVVMQGV